MRLVLRRSQRTAGMLGTKQLFQLEVRADISDAEKADIEKYRLGDVVLYKSHEVTGGSGIIGVASRLAWQAMTITVSVRDLAFGKRIECKDVVEMLAVEEQIVEAAKTFALVLSAASTFGGEEVVEL